MEAVPKLRIWRAPNSDLLVYRSGVNFALTAESVNVATDRSEEGAETVLQNRASREPDATSPKQRTGGMPALPCSHPTPPQRPGGSTLGDRCPAHRGPGPLRRCRLARPGGCDPAGLTPAGSGRTRLHPATSPTWFVGDSYVFLNERSAGSSCPSVPSTEEAGRPDRSLPGTQ
jgi:hypothetical protein